MGVIYLLCFLAGSSSAAAAVVAPAPLHLQRFYVPPPASTALHA
jgi:hypothetical protein